MGTIWLIRHGKCVISTGLAFATCAPKNGLSTNSRISPFPLSEQ